MSPEGWVLYTEAVALWKKRKYSQAKERLSELPLPDKAYPKVILLYAYIQRDNGEFITEIETLSPSIFFILKLSFFIFSTSFLSLNEII